MSNANMNLARVAKDDEFYTLMPDIEKELRHYKQHLKGAVVYCPCDHPDHSNFIKYFKTHFDGLGLRGLLYSHGDFRSAESLELMRQSDIVITNPPFSLFREFLDLLMDEGKKFLIIGNFNAIVYKNCWQYIMDGRVWIGASKRGMDFDTSQGVSAVNACWFTNLDYDARRKRLRVSGMYWDGLYPKYDDVDAIEVRDVCHIPADYDGVMGVPVTFLERWNPDQFEIVGGCPGSRSLYVNGVKKYSRIFIRHRRDSVSTP